MKYNIIPENCKFIVNKEKRRVVCILEYSNDLFIDFILSNCELGKQLWPSYKVFSPLIMPNRFIGIATCSENDEWDEEIGKRIAFSRMKDKVNRSFFKRAKTYIQLVDGWINDTVDLLNKIGEKLEINQVKRYEYLNSLIGSEEET